MLRQLKLKNKHELKNRAEEQSCGEIMAEEVNGRNDPPPRRVLGDYALQQGPNTSQALLFLTQLEQ